jgi:hypothetical protein
MTASAAADWGRAVAAAIVPAADACLFSGGNTTFTLDDETEHYLRAVRAKSDLYGALFDLTQSAEFALGRIKTLAHVLTCGIDPILFRNVVRQAHYETASAHMALAAATTPSAAEHYASAMKSLDAFVASFEAEIERVAAARVAANELPWDDNEFTSFGLGLMHRARVALRLADSAKAVASASRVVTLLEQQKAVAARQRAKRETVTASGSGRLETQAAMARQLLEVLGASIPTAATLPAVVPSNAKKR